MCKCTPYIRTPWCGKGDCVPFPEQEAKQMASALEEVLQGAEQLIDDFKKQSNKITASHTPPTEEELREWENQLNNTISLMRTDFKLDSAKRLLAEVQRLRADAEAMADAIHAISPTGLNFEGSVALVSAWKIAEKYRSVNDAH